MEIDICEKNAPAGPDEFTDAMDPLLAAAAHNKESSPLLKLPDEVLLGILHLLQSDLRDIYYIRRVCRKLRDLTSDHTLEPGLFKTNESLRGSHMLHGDKFLSRENNRMPFGILPRNSVPGFVATIRKETLFASSAKGSENDFFKAVSDFHIMCKHPSHKFPHSGLKTLTAPENGQIEATRLRELYGEFGKNAARFIVPGPSQNTTPEILCFDPDKCGHILYRNGERPQATPAERLCTPHLSGTNRNSPVTATEIPFDGDHQDASRFTTGLGWTDHYVEFNEARGQSGIYVYECDEKHNSQDSTRCLMTSYRRTIPLGHINRRLAGDLNPCHQWFHAVDQDSYPSIHAEGGIWARAMAYFDRTKSRPRCRDTACRNYFQSPGPWHEHDMHSPCRIEYDFEEQSEFCPVARAAARAEFLLLYNSLRHSLWSWLLDIITVVISRLGAGFILRYLQS
ncbi:hypothetical protein INS49_002302 [Diaporthe citri]|uniref:uncharacterized protein n=1 Tax=Diaporthe citri TaxID=83186 RepID=UPI001C81F756|nr:uncharacterized protein INS49_002302 [Diaporthe citri]KAG6368102.1 hypothetical protein INS49_002302 [Diaporthe citri]